MESSNNQTFKTAGGHTVVLRPFITGRDAQAMSQITADTEANKNILVSNKSMELVVVSLDGITEGVVEKILDLPFADYIEIMEKVLEVTTGKKKETTIA